MIYDSGILVLCGDFLFCYRKEVYDYYPNKFVQMTENRFRIFNTLFELPGKSVYPLEHIIMTLVAFV